MKFVLKIPKNLLSVLLLPSLLTTEWIWVGLANFLDKIEMWLPQLDHRSRFSPAGGYWERIKMQPYEYELMSYKLWVIFYDWSFILCKIDSAVRCNIGEYPTLEFKDSYHTCGVFATLAFFFIDSVSNSPLRIIIFTLVWIIPITHLICFREWSF